MHWLPQVQRLKSIISTFFWLTQSWIVIFPQLERICYSFLSILLQHLMIFWSSAATLVCFTSKYHQIWQIIFEKKNFRSSCGPPILLHDTFKTRNSSFEYTDPSLLLKYFAFGTFLFKKPIDFSLFKNIRQCNSAKFVIIVLFFNLS